MEMKLRRWLEQREIMKNSRDPLFHPMPGEPKWRKQLANWSARPPDVRGQKINDVRVWLCETYHGVNELDREISAARKRIAELEDEKMESEQ